jgi:hypothetical protein
MLSLLQVNAQDREKVILPVDKETDCELRYYYFPNMQVYYDMKKGLYHYQKDQSWIVATELPRNYGGYSLFKNERVLITDFDGEQPEIFIKIHKKMYPYNPKGRIKRPLQSIVQDYSTALND